MENNVTLFTPIYGTEAQIINASNKNEGDIYVASDTKKIFIYADGTFSQIGGSGGSGGGGSTSLFWANASEEAGTIRQAPDLEDGSESNVYYIRLSVVEGDSIPDNSALIINSDGRFFKVIDNSLLDDGTFTTELIAVSGGGGGGGSVTVEDMRILRTDSWRQNQTFIYHQDYFIEIGGESDIDDFVDLNFLVTQDGAQIESFSARDIPSGSYYRFNTARLPKGTGISIQVEVDSANTKMGTRRPKLIINNLTTVELVINEDPNFKTSKIATGELNLSFQTKGNGLSQKLYVLIDGEELDLNADQRNKRLLNITQTGTQTVILPEQSHGVHNVELYVTTVISENELASDSLKYELAWKDNNDETPIVWLGDINTKVVNYDEAIIHFMVYDPVAEGNSEKTSAYLYYNNVEIPTSPMEVQYDEDNWVQWDVTNLYQAAEGDPGQLNRFKIVCGGTAREVVIYVTTDGSRDLGLVNENALILNLNSVGRSNQETSTSRVTWASNGHAMQFEDFNWYNNGWKNDNDGFGSYLSIANGAKAKINLGDLQLNSSADYSFEIRFRVRNIQEYSTLIKTIPYYKVEENDDSWPVATIKENNWTIKTDKDGNMIMDEKASIKVISQTAGVVAKYLNNAGQGLCIGTQEAYFNTPGSVANVRYKEDEIINISFVVSKSSHLLSIYLNGILSGALDLTSVSSFSMTSNNYFEFSSEFCDIDIFKIRIYRAELSMPDVIHNYISDIHDIDLYDQNQLTAESDGTILLYSELVKYNKENPDKLSMPYAVFEIIDNGFDEAGNVITDPNKATHGSDDDKLPVFKGNNRYCKVTFVNPVLDKALEDGTITEEFYYTHSPSYVGIGVDINVQGTSSQAYPRRNFKTKFKSATKQKDGASVKHNDWGWFYTKGSKAGERFKAWNMDNEYCNTSKFTWKIDYMESSGSYNTGFANLVGNNIYDYHPLSRYSGFNNDGTGFRTSVYGFPVLVFHKHSTSADRAYDENDEYLAYEYIGRYNLNLDKSANEFYGFEIKGEHPFVNQGWDEEDDEGQVIHHDHPKIADIAECWELRDNQGTWTSFKYPDAAARANHFGTTTNEGTLEVIKHFEQRYNNEGDQIEFASGISSADDLGYTDVTAVEMADGSTRDLSTQANKNAYLREKYSHLEELFDWLDSTDTSVVPPTDTGNPLPQPVTYTTTVNYMVETFHENGAEVAYYVDINGNQLAKLADVVDTDERNYYVYEVNGENIMAQAIAAPNYTGVTRGKDDILVTYNTDCAEYRLKKFINEFSSYLDLEYCLVYFILTELLLCYDSRGKNMMIASWGPQTTGGHYIWFPIFYDIDTQLGLNNIGAVLWDYDTDATFDGTFSTAKSVLWQNFFNGFRSQIESKYRALRKGSRLTETTIEGAYLCDPDVFKSSYAMRGVRPVIAIGLDEWYKYIAPGITKNSWYTGSDRRYGFWPADGSSSKTSDASYVYTCQGDRKLSRELFIRNRLNYLDSWWLAGAYDRTGSAYKTEIMIRANANDTSTSDTYLDRTKISTDVPGYTRTTYPVAQLDAVPRFEITPFLAQYVTVFYDEDPITPTIKYDGINPVTTNTTPSVENGYRAIYPYNEQLTYIPGGDFLSDIGDISLKYPSHFKLNHAKRLTQLKLGNDHPLYFNGILGSQEGTFDLNDSASTDNKKGLLQTAIFTGLTNLKGVLDVGGSEKLREFRALNTQISDVIFADGTPLDTIHIPKSVNRLSLVYARNLHNILTNPPEVMIEDENQNYVYNNKNNYEGLYVEGVTDYDAADPSPASQTSKLETINLSNVALGYESYKLIQNATLIRENYRSQGFLALNLENVDWTPFHTIENDVVYNPLKQFYVLTDHNDFEEYVHTTSDRWEELKLNDKIYTCELTGKEDYIQDLSLLALYNTKYDRASGLADNYYRNTRASEVKTRPNITGVMYINNTPETAIDEMLLQDVYKVTYPNLEIHAKYVNHAYLAKFVQRLDSGKDLQVDLIRYAAQGDVYPTMSAKRPSKVNYDFQGWTTSSEYCIVGLNDVQSLINSGDILTQPSDFQKQDLKFGPSQDAITFYAVFSITSYNFNFRRPDGSLLKAYAVNYGSYLPSTPLIWPAYDDNELDAEQTYGFIGWVTSQDQCIVENKKNAKLVDFATIMSQNDDKDFYACFTPVGLKENKIPEELCRTRGIITVSSQGIDYSGYELDLSNWEIIEGKITLPTSSADGTVYVKIADNCFGQTSGTNDRSPSYVFWDGTPSITHIGNNAFRNKNNLIYFEWPESIKEISSFAFQNCTSLSPIRFNEGLNFIGQAAFQIAFNPNIIYDRLYLPQTLASLMAYSLAISSNNITLLEVGNEFGNSLERVQDNVFGNASSQGLGSKIDSVIFHGVVNDNLETQLRNVGFDIRQIIYQ